MAPKLKEKCFDPACGTFGFMISAFNHAIPDKKVLFSLEDHERALVNECYQGIELVPDAHRLALMNASLHSVPAHIHCGDSLSPTAKKYKEQGFNVVFIPLKLFI